MDKQISPGSLSGEITPPPSKSLTQRALAAALLHHGTTLIHNMGDSDDELAALNIIQQLGATVERVGERTLKITSQQPATHDLRLTTIDASESALAARLFTLVACLGNAPVTITGKGSLLNRDMSYFTELL